MTNWKFTVNQTVRISDTQPTSDVLTGTVVEGMRGTASGNPIYLVEWSNGSEGWVPESQLTAHHELEPIQASMLEREIKPSLTRPWTGQDTDLLRAIYRSGLVIRRADSQ